MPRNWKEFQNGYLVTRQESMSALCYNVSVDKVAYTKPDAEYLEKRGLRRQAHAVISDDFLGWNVGLARGFGGMLSASV